MKIKQGDYQELSRLTYKEVDCSGDLAYLTLGLVDEAGEVAGKVKKLYRDSGGIITEEHRHAILLELGDCAWYLTQLATNLGYTLEEVAEANIEKLRSRYERGVIGGSGDNR